MPMASVVYLRTIWRCTTEKDGFYFCRVSLPDGFPDHGFHGLRLWAPASRPPA
jgi:hypothetical protein